MKKTNFPFTFTSKADTIDFFYNKIKKSKIEKFFIFSVEEWNENNNLILNKIKKEFNTKIVVRSSAIGEDSIESSQAGKFETIFNVQAKEVKQVSKAISHVIKSYKTKGFDDKLNQVLIQKQTLDSVTSGVVFTKTPENGAPYYVINYEDGKSTDSVTKGIIANTVKINNEIDDKLIPNKWKMLILAIKEIENICKNNQLDIEFAITNSNIIIFQVRPLTTINKKFNKEISRYVKKAITSNEKKFTCISKSKKSKIKKVIFSNMTDWNPAEIIGERPKKMEFSLYDHLIMKNSWNKGRIVLGYNDVRQNLMEDFSGKPYVNVQASFNSLCPNTINKKLQIKLLNYFLSKLKENPHLHDKVEFEILFTCYDFTIDKRMKDLLNYGFSENELKQLKKTLVDFTNKVISYTPEIIKETYDSLEYLEVKRKEINFNKKNYIDKLNDAKKLLEYCKKYGAVPFSTIARLAFIANILLQRIPEISNIKKHKIDEFMNSISTPVTKFQDDLVKLNQKNFSKKQFLLKYGHLRPGTYDITIQRYDKMPKFLDSFKFLDFDRPKKIKKISEKSLKEILGKHELKFEEISFFDFIIKTISLREKTKFEFTKTLSDAIELIADAGDELGFTREQLSYLSINEIFDIELLKKEKIQKKWNESILNNKKEFFKNEFVELPPIIFSKNDFSVIPYYIAKPNYITKKNVVSEIKLLNNLQDVTEIDSKIVLIENADPGFDWIFAKKPKGLITKYGGVASHMAIRCAELGLPAAIGCGDILFNKLKMSSKIHLNCQDNDILILEFKQKDEHVEEKKILKSLGYIK